VKIPLSSGRNTAAIVELASRNHILKQQGVFTAAELEEKILKSMEDKSKP
jgi:HPr kinase/phosphorylase